MKLGDRIKERRLELGMSQDRLAELAGYKGRSSINKIELNKANIMQSKLLAIATALRVTPGALLSDLDDYDLDAKDALSVDLLSETDNALIQAAKRMDDSQRERLLEYAEFLLQKQ